MLIPTSFRTLAAGAAILFGASLAQPAWAQNEFSCPLTALANYEIRAIAADPALIEAIKAQNEASASYDQAKIDSLDAQWRAEVGTASMPLIDATLANPASAYLAGVKEASGGKFTEIFAMDAKGLNVGQSDVTSDYWQGDEDKWTQTFGAGADAVHLGDVEQDESTQIFQSQVSVPVIDPEGGAVIGAITFGVDVSKL